MLKQQDQRLDLADGAAALSKGLLLLRAIVADRGVTNVGVLGEKLGLSRTTVHRMITELQRHGLVMRTRRGRYGPGLGLLELSSGLSVQGQLAEAARQPLRQLVEACGLTAHLGVMQNDMVTYLVKSPGRSAAVIFTREQGQLEAYCSGIGKILLAHLPDQERAAYLAGGPFVPLTSRTLVDPAHLAEALDLVRANGFASDEGEIADGLRCLAVPVRNPHGRVAAAVSVSMMNGDRTPGDAALLSLLRETAAEIGERLTSRPARPHA